MSCEQAGVHGTVAGQKIFFTNGRLRPEVEKPHAAQGMAPGWSLEHNGFCLLTGQPMSLSPELQRRRADQAAPLMFRFLSSGQAEIISPAEMDRAAASDFAPYYKEIAEAAKVAFPEAEYVVVGGHITFAADVSPMRQIGVLLFGALQRKLSRLISQLLPCAPWSGLGTASTSSRESNGPSEPLEFGATQFIHVDMAKEQGAERLAQGLSGKDSASGLNFPEKLISAPSKERIVVSVNLWRNGRAEASIKNHHLAVLDAQTLSDEELLAGKFKNMFIGGQEQYRLSEVQDKHRMVYFPDMVQSEILVFKQGAYIVQQGATESDYCVTPAPGPHTNFIFHTAFADPTAPRDHPPRRAVVCAGVQVLMPETDRQA